MESAYFELQHRVNLLYNIYIKFPLFLLSVLAFAGVSLFIIEKLYPGTFEKLCDSLVKDIFD